MTNATLFIEPPSPGGARPCLRAGRRSGTALPRKAPRAPWDLNAVFARPPLGLALLNSLAMMSIGQASSPAKNMTAPTAVRGKFAVDSPLEGSGFEPPVPGAAV